MNILQKIGIYSEKSFENPIFSEAQKYSMQTIVEIEVESTHIARPMNLSLKKEDISISICRGSGMNTWSQIYMPKWLAFMALLKNEGFLSSQHYKITVKMKIKLIIY